MGLDATAVLATAGLVAVAAVAGAAAFGRTRVPDVLLLLLFGVLVGPVLHVVLPGLFRSIAPIASLAAVLVILFDAGLDIHREELREGALPALGIAVLAFALTAGLAGLAAHALLGLPWALSLLLGMAFGGAGVTIVLPLIQRMGVGRAALAIVSLETAIADVLLVVGVFSACAVLASGGDVAPQWIVLRIAASFAVAAAVGVLAGALWLRLLDRPWARGHESLATVGSVFLVYAAAEALYGSGPLAVLAYALVLGNSRHARTILPPSLSLTSAPTFHRQAALAVRAFVFVGIGATLDLRTLLDLRLLLFALAATAAVVAARLLALRVAARRLLADPWDHTAVALMFPLGLPTAAASLLPATRFGLAGTQQFPQVAAVVIFLTIVVSSAGVAAVLQPRLRRRIEGHAGAA